jgi:hypothetical protein
METAPGKQVTYPDTSLKGFARVAAEVMTDMLVRPEPRGPDARMTPARLVDRHASQPLADASAAERAVSFRLANGSRVEALDTARIEAMRAQLLTAPRVPLIAAELGGAHPGAGRAISGPRGLRVHPAR